MDDIWWNRKVERVMLCVCLRVRSTGKKKMTTTMTTEMQSNLTMMTTTLTASLMKSLSKVNNHCS